MPTSAHWEVTNLQRISVKTVHSAWADVGIGPYKPFLGSVGNFELLQITRERSKKTEEVFLVGSRGLRGEIEIPPGLKLQTSEAFAI